MNRKRSGLGKYRTNPVTGVVPAAVVTVVLIACLLMAESASAVNPLKSIPNSYIAGYAQRGVKCLGWTSRYPRTWVSWQTFVAGSIGTRWATSASTRKLCLAAESAGQENLALAHQVGWGPGRKPFPMKNAGLREQKTTVGAPRGWSCYVLPSSWKISASELARLAGKPLTSGSEAYATAQGLVNSFYYCVSASARRGDDGIWRGGDFISWGPSVKKCDQGLELEGRPDPDNPLHQDPNDPLYTEVFPPFSEVSHDKVVGFYKGTSCVPVPPKK